VTSPATVALPQHHRRPVRIGKFAISFCIGKQGLESTYGSSASIVIVFQLGQLFRTDRAVRRGADFRA
jgi:hypothetical protein